MPLRGKSRLRPNALATVLHAIPLALLLATASSASGQQPASTPSGMASNAACHDPTGWNIACLRALFRTRGRLARAHHRRRRAMA
ncbi:hypothetical protein WJ978_27545 [Achromobacter xylosoxidans]